LKNQWKERVSFAKKKPAIGKGENPKKKGRKSKGEGVTRKPKRALQEKRKCKQELIREFQIGIQRGKGGGVGEKSFGGGKSTKGKRRAEGKASWRKRRVSRKHGLSLKTT